jgi:hypothetical protein
LRSATGGLVLAKKARDLEVRHHQALTPRRSRCPVCGARRGLDYTSHRSLRRLGGLPRLDLAPRRCPNAACAAHRRPYRPEAEGRFALPPHEFGLDVIALLGALRYAEHRTAPEAHQLLLPRGLPLPERGVPNLLGRDDELLAVALTEDRRLQKPT